MRSLLHRHLPRAKILEISLDLLHSAAGAENSGGGGQVGRCTRRVQACTCTAAGAAAAAGCLCAAAPLRAADLRACYAILERLQNSGIRVPLFPAGSLHKSLNSLNGG